MSPERKVEEAGRGESERRGEKEKRKIMPLILFIQEKFI